jgi:hypothetical protein
LILRRSILRRCAAASGDPVELACDAGRRDRRIWHQRQAFALAAVDDSPEAVGRQPSDLVADSLLEGQIMPSLEWNRRFGMDLVRFSREGSTDHFYGDQWGSIKDCDGLIAVRKRFLDPFLSPDRVCMEIGGGGGRWTQYLLPCKELICAELNPKMFDYIRNRFDYPKNIVYIATSGHDLPSVLPAHVDFVFSFSTFVHLEMAIIARYVGSISLVMKPGADVALQISNKYKEHALTAKPYFSDNSPEFMVDIFARHGLQVVEIDNDVLFHSTMIHGRKL